MSQSRASLFLLISVALFASCSVIFLNVTGFCYSQMRYVSDDEMLLKTLEMDWQKNIGRVKKINPSEEALDLPQFVRHTPIFGRVGGRRMRWKLLFWKDPTIDVPRDIFRIFGNYVVVASLAFDTGAGKLRYLTWYRGFNRCGETTHATSTDEDIDMVEDEWNGGWRRIDEEDGKINFVKKQNSQTRGPLK